MFNKALNGLKFMSRGLINPSTFIITSQNERIPNGALIYSVCEEIGRTIIDRIIGNKDEKTDLHKAFGLSEREISEYKRINSLSGKLNKSETFFISQVLFDVGKKQIIDDTISSFKQDYPVGSIAYNKFGIEHKSGNYTDLLELKSLGANNGKYIVYFNGNAKFYEDRIREAADDVATLGCNAIIFNYIGVGNSKGRLLSEETLVEQGMDIVKELMERHYITDENRANDKDIYLNGFSIGSAVALLTANRLKKEGINVKVFSDRGFAKLEPTAKDLLFSHKYMLKYKLASLALCLVTLPISIPLLVRNFRYVHRNWKMDAVSAYKELDQKQVEHIVIRPGKENIDSNKLKDQIISYRTSLHKVLQKDQKLQILNELQDNLKKLKEMGLLDNVEQIISELNNIRTRKNALKKLSDNITSLDESTYDNNFKTIIANIAKNINDYMSLKQTSKDKKMCPQKDEYEEELITNNGNCKPDELEFFLSRTHTYDNGFLKSQGTGKSGKETFYEFVRGDREI